MITGSTAMALHTRSRLGPLTLGAIGLALVVGAVSVSSASAAPAGPADPRQLLQCKSDSIVVGEFTYGIGSPDTATPEQIVDRWTAARAAHGRVQAPASVVKRTQFRSSDKAQISVLSSAGKVDAVVTMKHTAELGWHIEVIHACA